MQTGECRVNGDCLNGNGAFYFGAFFRNRCFPAALRASRGVDFVDRDDDHPTDVLPPIGAPLWSADGATVLLNSEAQAALVALLTLARLLG